MKNILIAVVVSVLVTFGAMQFFSSSEKPAGASSGPDHYNIEQFFGGAVFGSSYSTTTAAATTLKASDVANYDTIVVTPGVVTGVTYTLFASSSATSFLPRTGMTQRTCIVNGTTTADVALTLAGGTGTLVQVASSSVSAVGSLAIYPGKTGCITFVRGPRTATTFDINAALTVFK